MRTLIKQVVETTLVASGIAAIARRSTRGRTLVLAYHNVVPDGDEVRGDASLHLPQRHFASQLDTLGLLGDVVPLAMIDGERRSTRPRFAVTFDDAYTGALTVGVDELRRRGMPATVFVAPGLIGLTPWWDLLASETGGEVDARARDHAISVLAGRRDAVLAWSHGAPGSDHAEVGPRIASNQRLRDALATDGMSVGSHTSSHPNLTALEGAELNRELVSSANWLRDSFPERYIPWLAYPYGLANEVVERSSRSAGYVAALRVDGGWMRPWSSTNRFALPRLNVPRGISDAGFTLRLSGIGVRRPA